MNNFLKSTAFLAIVACLLWSSAFAGVKIGLKYMSPLQFAGIRFFISGLLIIPVFGQLKTYFTVLRTYFGYILWVSFLQTVLMYALFYTGINMVPGAVGAMIIGASPLFVALVAHIAMHDDKITYKKIASVLLGVLGIVIINVGRQSAGLAGPLEIIGVLILVANNLVSGFYNVVIVKSNRPVPPLVLSSAALWIGGLILMFVSLPLEGLQPKSYPTEFWVSLAWLSFVSAAAYSIWFTLLKRPGIKISNLNTWKFIIPVFGAILSWLLLTDESPDVYSVVGMIVVGSSLLVMNHEALNNWFKNKKKPLT